VFGGTLNLAQQLEDYAILRWCLCDSLGCKDCSANTDLLTYLLK